MSLAAHINWLISKVDELRHGAKKDLASAMGITSSALSKVLKGERELSATELERAILFFNDSPSSVRTPQRMVPIVGLAGAGPDGSVLYGKGDQNFGETPAPEGAADDALALEVRGVSMRGFADDGWLIFYEDREPPREEHLGEPCVCFLEDERVLVKTPWQGSKPGLFHLESFNAPMMFDVAVRYFAFVTDIKPRRSAKKFARLNPEHQIDDVTRTGRKGHM